MLTRIALVASLAASFVAVQGNALGVNARAVKRQDAPTTVTVTVTAPCTAAPTGPASPGSPDTPTGTDSGTPTATDPPTTTATDPPTTTTDTPPPPTSTPDPAWETLKGDVADIGDDLILVRDDLAGFNASSSYFQALAIDTDAQTLLTGLKTATTDAGAITALTVNQTAFGLLFLQDLVPIIQATLELFIEKEPIFKAKMVAGIAKQDNADLNAASDAFADALLAIADPSGKDQGVAIKAALDAAFANSTAAYANDN